MGKDQGIFMDHAPSFSDQDSAQYISDNLYQRVSFPKEYPAIILVHQEQPAQSVPLHWHPGPELIYTRNRKLTVTIDGVKNVVSPGEFIIISSCALHSVIPTPDHTRQDVLGITFHAEYLEHICPNLGELVISRNAPGVTADSYKKMIVFCEQLRKHVAKGENSGPANFETNKLLFSILQMMYSDFLMPVSHPNHKKREVLNKLTKILNYMEEHYKEDLTTQFMADHFGYTREYFCRFFKFYANQTFKQYLMELRLNAAAAELRISDQSVGQVALSHGFPSEKAFFVSFKKKYGMTPVQFRKNG